MVSDFSIAPNDLLPLIGTAQAPLLIDVCIAEDIAAAPWRLPGARHVPHLQVTEWIAAGRQSLPVVLICQKGLKLSHGVAARMRAAGLDARVLRGGNQAWCAAHYPRLSVYDVPLPGSAWVLPATLHPRQLCLAWLIRRWFDPRAELLWVPQDMVGGVAARFEATPGPQSLAALCTQAQLDYPPLSDFCKGIDNDEAPWLPLLDALPRLCPRMEDQVERALCILDTAWVAQQGAAQ